MKTISAIARHDLRLVLTDKGAVLWMFLLPVVFATFFGLVLGGGSSSSDDRARLTVVDGDGGPIARLLLNELESEQLVLIHVAPEDKDSTPNKVRTLVLPPGLSESVFSETRTTIRLEKDPDTSAEAALVVQARIVTAIAKVLGRLIEVREGLEPGAAVPVDLLNPIDPTVDLVLVESRFAGEASVPPSGFAQSIPGNAVMFVLLIALTYGAASVSGERSGGQLRRLATTPAGRWEIITGKIVGRTVVAWAQVTVLMITAMLGSFFFGIHIGDHPVTTWLVLIVYSAAVAPLGVAFGAWITDPDRAASIGVITTMAMAAFGGCWWPLEVVSKPLQTLAMAFPTGWAMRALHGTISFGHGLDGILQPLAVLFFFGAAFTWIAVRSLRFE